MTQKTDLYSILVSYANKNNSPYIDIDPFLDFLGRLAKKYSEDQPEWLKWAHDRPVKFWAELAPLVEEDKCELLTDTESGRIYMPHYYLDVLKKAYQNAEEDADLPFPSEDFLRITLPENQVRLLSSENDILAYLERPQESDVPILKINFHEDCGSSLFLANMLPRRLTEIAILKLRNYVQKGGNKDYLYHKLAPQLQGKESYLRDQFNQILLRPLECYSSIESGSDFSYLFWAHFCILIKNDIKKKKERLSEDVAAYQSVVIIDVISGYYKSLAVKQREVELAFKSLELHLAKPPYLYTLNQILKFTSAKGVLLLGQYTEDNLETWLKEKTTTSKNNQLPILLIVQTFNDERFYILKEKLLALCSRLLAEGRVKIKEELSKQWRKLLLEYESEGSMEDDREFEKYLEKLTDKLCPTLAAVLEDPKLLLVQEEMENGPNSIPMSVRFYNKGQLLPYSSLLLMRRREMLSDTRLVLPFWYSLPIITPIIAFFKRLAKNRSAPKLSAAQALEGEHGPLVEIDRAREIRTAAEDLEIDMVPSGYTLDSYLEELENRWSRLIDKQARENLIEDVKSLIRDNLRRNLKIQKNFSMSREAISQLATNIVLRTPTLVTLSGRESLILYAELYLLKLLEHIK